MNRTALLTLGVAISMIDRAPLAAQRGDVALGVTLNTPVDVNVRPKCTELGLPCGSPRTFPDFGFVVQGALHASAHVSVVAEAGMYANSWDTVGVDRALTNHVSAVLVGSQLTTGTRTLQIYKDTTRYRAYAQFLGGAETSTVLPTRFAVQPGAGFDVKLSWPRAWIRVAYDYRLTRGSPRNLSGSRVLCALVLSNAGGS